MVTSATVTVSCAAVVTPCVVNRLDDGPAFSVSSVAWKVERRAPSLSPAVPPRAWLISSEAVSSTSMATRSLTAMVAPVMVTVMTGGVPAAKATPAVVPVWITIFASPPVRRPAAAEASTVTAPPE